MYVYNVHAMRTEVRKRSSAFCCSSHHTPLICEVIHRMHVDMFIFMPEIALQLYFSYTSAQFLPHEACTWLTPGEQEQGFNPPLALLHP